MATLSLHTFTQVEVMTRRESLAEALVRNGVRIPFSMIEARRQQKEKILEHRSIAGIWKHLWVIPQFFFRFGKAVAFTLTEGAFVFFMCAMVWATLARIARGGDVEFDFSPAIAFAVWAAAAAIGAGVAELLYKKAATNIRGGFVVAAAYWLRQPVSVNRAIPKEVRRNIAGARRVPGVKVYVESLDVDPYAFAVRRSGPFGIFREEECIGVWV